MTDFIERKPPKGMLNTQGRAYYNRHFRRLVEENVLQESDYDSFLELCTHYGTAQQLRREIKAEGEMITGRDGNPVRNPKLIRLKDSEAKFMRLSHRFALDPKSRKRIKIEPPKEKSELALFCEYCAWIDATFQQRMAGEEIEPPEHLRAYFYG